MSRSEPPNRSSEDDGRIDVGLQFILGLFLVSAFTLIVWLMFAQ